MRDIIPAVGVASASSAGEPGCAAAAAPPTRSLLQRRHAENKKYKSECEDHGATVKFKPVREEEEGGDIWITAGAR